MRVITLDTNKKVIGTKTVGENYILQTNDLVSNIGEVGQVRQIDGSFITPTPTAEIPQITFEDKINYLYYKSMEVI